MTQRVLQNFSDNASTESFFTNFVFVRYADKRVNDWPLMETPHKAAGIIIFYLFAIYLLLPMYMKNKKPYELKALIKAYNVFQIVFCSFLVHRTLTSGWTTTYTLGCEPIAFSDDPLALQMASCFWWNMLIKGIEFIETIIFALRKKTNQISLLHVYHHVSTFFMAWMCCKYGAGGMLSFTIVLNSCVHVLMYSYYFLASLGPEMQKRLTFIKSKLTIIQLTQLIILFLHTLQALAPSCSINIVFPAIFLPMLAGNITLFLKFYRKSYLNKKSQ